MKTFYNQCRLKRGNLTTVTWIPEKYAKVGCYISLKENDKWSDAWLVDYVNHQKTDSPPDWRKLIKQHRKNTGDSMPKRKNARKKF